MTPPELNTNPEQLRSVLEENKSEMLIMIDGLDEYNGNVPVLGQLFLENDEDSWYSGCGLLVTSRPTAGSIDTAWAKSQRNYELVGFAPAQMRDFVTKCLAMNRNNSAGGGGDGTRHGKRQPPRRQASGWAEPSGIDAENATKLLAAIEADVALAAACQTAYTLSMVCAIYTQGPEKFDAGTDVGGVKLTQIYFESTLKSF